MAPAPALVPRPECAPTIARIVGRLNLPSDTTARVVAVQSEMQQRASALLSDRRLSSTERQAQLSGLGREAMTKLTSILGGPGFSAYQQNGGNWVNTLMRPAH